MARRPRAKSLPYQFGRLLVTAINAALQLELDDGDAVMSIRAQEHAQRWHPMDFARCFPHVASIISKPLYARDDFRNDGKIELVGRPDGFTEYLLVAVEVVLDAEGRYNVTSFYPVSERKVNDRREKGHLVRVILI